MLSQRLTEPRRVVSLYDPALCQFSWEKRRKYQQSRDISDLGDIDSLPDKLTIYTIRPLLAEYEHLCGPRNSSDSDAPPAEHRTIFGLHVSKIENAPPEWGVFETRNDIRYLTEDAISKHPLRTVQEMAKLVVELANGDTRPFGSPVGWQAALVRTESLIAMNARTCDAKEKNQN